MKSLLELPKLDRPGVNLYIADLMGPRGMRDGDNSQGFFAAIQQLQRAVGLNTIVQVNDCETSGHWTESDDGVFDYAVGATGNRVGTNCLKLTATAATDASQYVQTILINESAYIGKGADGKRQMDWRDTDYIGFWKHAASSAHFGTAGELKFALVNNGVVSALQSIDGTAGTEHHWCQIDISSLSRDRVEAIRFYGNNANAAEDCYIDDIIRYKHQFHGGPLYGCGFPIKSGTTLTRNQLGTWSIDGIIASSATEVVADLGPHWFSGATATGTATRSVWAYFPGRFLYLAEASAATVAGEGLISSGAATVEGATDGVEEIAHAKGLEAAGAAGDHIFAIFDTGGRFIS